MSVTSRRISAGATVTPPLLHRRAAVLRPFTAVRFNNSPTYLGLTQHPHRRISAVTSAAGENWRWLSPEKKKSPTTSFSRCNCAVGEGSFDLKEAAVVSGDRPAAKVVVAAAATVVLGVGNRVMYKLALVPLKQYPFFLAQFATFGYVIVYFSILYMRFRAGIVTKEMLSLPQAPYIAVGLLEALAGVAVMAATTMLPGASIPILSQTFLVWQLLLSMIFLGRRYNINQLVGCLLVSLGVIITVASGPAAGSSSKEVGIFWSLLMIFSFFLQAADTILKEAIFSNAAERLKGRTVDLFVVNSFGSAYQAIFVGLLLPVLSKLWGIPFYQLPSYLKDGAACFLNINGLATGCEGAPLLPVLFVIVNMCYNISLLYLLKISSALVTCLASTISVPLAVFVFTLHLPYLGPGTALPPGFLGGLIVLVLGLLSYSWRPAMVPASATT